MSHSRANGTTVVAAVPDATDDAILRTVDLDSDGRLVRDETVQTAGSLVAAVSRAFKTASASGRDAIIVRSLSSINDTLLARLNSIIAADPMIGMIGVAGVAPATTSGAAGTFTYTVDVGVRPVFVRTEILADFGPLDEAFASLGYAIEDLAMRANKCGFRCVVLNGSDLTDLAPLSSNRWYADWRRLTKRHPEYFTALRRERAARQPLPRASRTAAPAPRAMASIGFDFDNLRIHHDGTSELARAVCDAFEALYGSTFRIRHWGDPKVLAFHGLDRHMDGPEVTDVAFRFGQFWSAHEIMLLADRAPIIGHMFLDTIALDCKYLDTPDLTTLWADGFHASDFVFFNSRFTEQQTRLRFADWLPDCTINVLSSTDVADYRPTPGSMREPSDGHVLVVGNKYAHKNVAPTIHALARCETRPIVVLGAAADSSPGITYYPTGQLTAEEVRRLYDGSAQILFPSYYEGFGLPVMHALAAGKPIIARDLPVYREIAASCPQGHNIHLCRDTASLIRTVSERRPTWSSELQPVEPVSWSRSAEGIARVAADAFARFADKTPRARFTRELQARHAMEQYGRRTNRLVKSLRKRSDQFAAIVDPFVHRT